MPEEFPYADIIILALIAGFILLRLRSILGQKTGHENPNFFQPPQTKTQEKNEKNIEPIIQLSEKSLKARTGDFIAPPVSCATIKRRKEVATPPLLLGSSVSI